MYGRGNSLMSALGLSAMGGYGDLSPSVEQYSCQRRVVWRLQEMRRPEELVLEGRAVQPGQ